MQHNDTTSQRSARARRLTEPEAHDLGVRMLERLSCRTRQGSVVARVMRAISSMRHQTAGAFDAAVTLTRLSPDDARQLTEIAAEIVHGNDNAGGTKC